MQVIQEGGRPIKAWVDGVELEDEARTQLINASKLPFIFKHLAVMPDVHCGIGATIGSVIPTQGAVIPAAVGVDIGCGMVAQKLSLKASDLPDNLLGIRTAMEKAVPHGRTENGGKGDRGAWYNVPAPVGAIWDELLPTYKQIVEKHPRAMSRNTSNHLGTLGTGNHFIELCIDESHDVWIMLHSGSRGLGNRIGQYFIELAKKDMERFFINLPDKDLAYLPQGTPNYDDYLMAVSFAQDFAFRSRQLMLQAIVGALHGCGQLPEFAVLGDQAINCHHNYVQWENHFGQNILVTRKGAVRAREGDMGIIPGSMGAKSFIVRGKGNPDSFMSCSHGAGRRMSRTKAKAIYSIEDHINATVGVECRKDADVIDETPMAYKDIDAVIAAEADLIDVVHTLKQVVCVKG